MMWIISWQIRAKYKKKNVLVVLSVTEQNAKNSRKEGSEHSVNEPR